MSAQTGETPAANGRVRRLSPDEVRRHTFARAPLSRRGFDDEEVVEFLATVADQLAAMETEIEQVSDENRRLKHAMREWHRQQVGYDSAELMARTQQEIEEQIARAESYSREREEEAARRYEAIVAEAYQRAEEAVAARGRPVTGEHPVAEPPAVPSTAAGEETVPADPGIGAAGQLQVDGLLRALEGLAAHIDAARSLFAQEAGAAPDDDGRDGDARQGNLFGAEDGQGANGFGRPDGGPANSVGPPGGTGAAGGPGAARPGAFGGFEEPLRGGPQSGGSGEEPQAPSGPWTSGDGAGAPSRDPQPRDEEVERHDGFEVRRQTMPRPTPPRPARTPPAGAATEDGPDGPHAPA